MNTFFLGTQRNVGQWLTTDFKGVETLRHCLSMVYPWH